MLTLWTWIREPYRIPAVAVAFVLALVAARLTSHPPGHAPVRQLGRFELALGSEQSRALLDQWTPAERAAVRASLFYDFGFIVAYVALCALVCSRLAMALASTDERWSWFGQRLSYGFAVAGLLDVVENVGLLGVLRTAARPPWPLLAGLASVAKWAYLGFAAIYAVLGLILLALRAII